LQVLSTHVPQVDDVHTGGNEHCGLLELPPHPCSATRVAAQMPAINTFVVVMSLLTASAGDSTPSFQGAPAYRPQPPAVE
jgi:hypothetical protein